jgi:hypothetical protein
MFGINDLGILSAYILGFGCLVFAIWFGISRWNKDDNENPQNLDQ